MTNVIDRDGFRYVIHGGGKIVKSTDGGLLASVTLAAALPRELAARATRLLGLAPMPGGFLAAVTPGALIVLDADLAVRDAIGFDNERLAPGLAVDARGAIYVVTSRSVHKVVWTDHHLSFDPDAGAWDSMYGGGGTAPALLGTEADPHQLVVLAAFGTAIALWRDALPAGAPHRIADRVAIDVGPGPILAAPQVDGLDVVIVGSRVEKLVWNTALASFDRVWMNLGLAARGALGQSSSPRRP